MELYRQHSVQCQSLQIRRTQIEPCGIPYLIFNLLTKHSCILVWWEILLNQENICLRYKHESQYQCSFATSKE